MAFDWATFMQSAGRPDTSATPIDWSSFLSQPATAAQASTPGLAFDPVMTNLTGHTVASPQSRLAKGLPPTAHSARAANIAMQRTLRSHGYKLNVDGIVGPITRSAWQAYTHGISAAKWNASQGAPKSVLGPGAQVMVTKPSATASGPVRTVAATHAAAPTGGTLAGAQGAAYGKDGNPQDPTTGQSTFSSPPGLAALIKLVGGGVQQPINLADVMKAFPAGMDANAQAQAAGDVFKSQLADIADMVNLAQATGVQHLADINSWFGQVSGAQDQAGKNDAALSKAAESGISNSGNAILASLGGSANMGANPVAAEVQNGNNTIAALDHAQAQYDNSMGPIIKSQQATAQQQELARQSQERMQLDALNRDTLLQQSAAEEQARQAAAQQNQALALQKLQLMLDVQGKNQATSQQNFADKTGLLQLMAGMQSSGLNTAKILSEIQHQRAQDQIAASRAGAYNQSVLTKDQIALLNAQTNRIKAGGTVRYDQARTAKIIQQITQGPNQQFKVDTTKLFHDIGSSMDAQAGGVIKGYGPAQIAQRIGAALQGQGLKKGTPEYYNIARSIYQSFRDEQGRPLVANPSWFR